LKEYIVFFL